MRIKVEDLNFVYDGGVNDKTNALKNINLTVDENEFICIIGQTGSGKSTLIQHLNGLEKATSGKVYVDDKCIYDKDYDIRALCCKVGLVFQYPEHQLFEDTVFEDVCFGPKNQGLDRIKVEEKARQALIDVRLEKDCWDKSPFELSGGQKRKAAIAGILAMEPEILILDEPTAGLDPATRDYVLDLIASIREERKITVIMVSHNMEDVAKYADRIIVMDKGSIVFDDKPKKVFDNYKELEKMGLGAPKITYILNKLSEKGMPVDKDIINLQEAIDHIFNLLKN